MSTLVIERELCKMRELSHTRFLTKEASSHVVRSRFGKLLPRHEAMLPAVLFEAVGKNEFVEPVKISLEEADSSELVNQADTKNLLQ
jgi:hypothetical protein